MADRTQEARERAIRGAALEIGVEVAVQRMIAAEAKVAALEAEARRSRIDSPEAVVQLAHDVAGMEAWDNDTEVSFPLGEIRATLDRVSTLETALRPFAEKWDLHAAPYLNDTVDGEEARVLTARTVNEMIEDIKAARAALADGDTTADQNVTPGKAT